MDPKGYRLYVDESGDHTFKDIKAPHRRYLCILGCWFRNDHYYEFHSAFQEFRRRTVPHHPDEPLVLHREDILHARGRFWRLRDESAREYFDRELLRLIAEADFRVCGILIDKVGLQANYETPQHPYHLAMTFLLQRYCAELNSLGRHGDVMAESRGGAEDRLLKDCYEGVWKSGAWGSLSADAAQNALTSKQLKLKQKSADIAGLQLADILAHPVREGMLVERKLQDRPLSAFAQRVLPLIDDKYHRHFATGRIDAYGKVFFPDTRRRRRG